MESSQNKKFCKVNENYGEKLNDKNFFQVKITEIKIKRPFLKISTQNINDACYQQLKCLHHVFSATSDKDTNQIKMGDICVAKHGKEVYRCKMLEIENGVTASLNFIDFGFVGNLPLKQVKILPRTHPLYDRPPMCKDFFIAFVVIKPETLNIREKLTRVFYMLHNKIFDLQIIKKVKNVLD